MNAERLRGLIDDLIAADRKLGIQKRVQQLSDYLNQLSNNPQDATVQHEVVVSLDSLEDSLLGYFAEITPATKEAIDSIGATPFFSPALAAEVRESLGSNALTPAVPAQNFSERKDERSSYMEGLRALSRNFENIGIRSPVTDPGSAELSILIPRDLFRNELDPLSKELHTLHRIISFFSEAATGGPPKVEVLQISTSDPTFSLGLDVVTVGTIAASITWLLNTMKQALEIKEIWQKAKAAGFSDKELKIFEDKVEQKIAKSIDERISEILSKKSGARDARDTELTNGLEWAHRAILARIERGMTVEVRFLPPPEPEDEVADEAEVEAYREKAAPFEELRRLADQMDFPPPSGAPLLKLPNVDPPEPQGSPE